ncbi:cation transporter, partial [Candidatus Bathyarchaeota archaeon]|nr:cation transporter [Candidatus Bathyarchaeota archaeon]
MKIKKSTISISGMSCASCSQTIENVLKKTPGVNNVNVNLATEKAYVTYDTNKISEKELIVIINSTGYNASLETEKTIIKIGGMT